MMGILIKKIKCFSCIEVKSCATSEHGLDGEKSGEEGENVIEKQVKMFNEVGIKM